MTLTLDRTLVRNLLEHPDGYPWRMQNVGLLALRLDERREYRLHVWDPDRCIGDPPVHDHPFDFTSTVIVGEMTNTRYVEDPNGIEYARHRYRPGAEDARRTDSVRLTASETVVASGESYRQRSNELHGSGQVPGTVTLLQFGPIEERELTVCLAPGAPWVSVGARPATAAEVKRITGNALDHFTFS